MLTYTYNCPVRNRQYEIRIDYRTEWSNDETNITDGLVRVVDTTSHTEVYCSENAIFFFDPDIEEDVVQYLMFEARVLVPDPQILREQVFEAKRELQERRQWYDEALSTVRPLIETYRTIRPERADTDDASIITLMLSMIHGATHALWSVEEAERTLTKWENREADLRSASST
jgi:hypothetical protein